MTAGRPVKRIDFRLNWSCGSLENMQQDLDGVLLHLNRVTICAELE